MFASTAVALYGYDQGMMSLINTNYDYLETMGIAEEDPMVGIIVSIYYLGCAVGAIGFSQFADWKGRKAAIFFCLATASLGSIIMFVAGIGGSNGALWVMLVGRVVMGLGVGTLEDQLHSGKVTSMVTDEFFGQVALTPLSPFTPPKRKKMTLAAWHSHKSFRPTFSVSIWHSSSM